MYTIAPAFTSVSLSHRSLHKLQLAQSLAAKIITRSPSMNHIIPALRLLHWLFVQFCIQYKLLLTFKAIHNLALSYLSDLFQISIPSRSPRSSSSIHLSVPSACLTTMGSRAFSCSAPCLRNSLPPQLRNTDSLTHFKSQLITYLFENYSYCSI